MRTEYELVIRGEPAQLECLFARVESMLRNGWQRYREAEERAAQQGVPRHTTYCFSCTATDDRPAAAFWVRARCLNEWHVTHVMRMQEKALTEEERKRVLSEFEREFLVPAAVGLGVTTEIVEHRLTVENEMSREAADLLRDFSATANRNRLRPEDRRRWNAFLVQAHREEAFFKPALLDEWLEMEGWPQETRSQLVDEFEAARSLLEVYDEEAARR